MITNLFEHPKQFSQKELYITLLDRPEATVQKIVSSPMPRGDDQWYLQAHDELVFVLDGEAAIEMENEGVKKLPKGSYLLIPAHCKHRVAYTSSSPLTIWLTIHFK